MCAISNALLDRGDEAIWDLVAPEFVVDFSLRLIEPVVVQGRDKVHAFYDRQRRETWEKGHVGWEPQELIDAGDKVLAFIRTSGRGKGSGAEVEAYVWNVWTFSDGKPVRWHYFGEDRSAALEAAGLRE